MVHFNAQFRSLRVVIVFVLTIVVFSCRTARAEERVATEEALMRIRVIAANLEARLEMTQNVQIWIVPHNARTICGQSNLLLVMPAFRQFSGRINQFRDVSSPAPLTANRATFST